MTCLQSIKCDSTAITVIELSKGWADMVNTAVCLCPGPKDSTVRTRPCIQAMITAGNYYFLSTVQSGWDIPELYSHFPYFTSEPVLLTKTKTNKKLKHHSLIYDQSMVPNQKVLQAMININNIRRTRVTHIHTQRTKNVAQRNTFPSWRQ